MRYLIAAILVFLAGAAPAAAPAADMAAYLVQTVCPDGSLPVTACDGARPVRASDKMRFRRHDWPAPDGYQISDAVLEDGRPTLIWTFAPFGPANPARGDGGEIYQPIGDGAWAITATQDGGTPRMQYFVGAACGGTGWLVFRPNARSGQWRGEVARLSGTADPGICPPLGEAYTRWRREMVTIPFLVGGQVRAVPTDTVISEHYDGTSIAASQHLERSFYGRGWGRLIWEAWGLSPAKVDLSARCPGTVWSVPPRPGWQLQDCRTATNIREDEAAMSAAQIGWPAANASRGARD